MNNVIISKDKQDFYKSELLKLSKDLQNPNLTGEDRENLEDKLNTVEFEATQWAINQDKAAPRSTEANPPVPTPATGISTMPDGIDNAPIVPRPLPGFNTTASIINSWRKTIPDHYYLVYAGYVTTNPEQGMVLVLQPQTNTFHQVLTPSQSGGIKVISEDGPYLTLVSSQGQTFYFDPAG